jgi:hypothetical protein
MNIGRSLGHCDQIHFFLLMAVLVWSLRSFFFSLFFVCVCSFINSSVSNRNSTLHFLSSFYGAEKKMMIHLGVKLLPPPRIVLSLSNFLFIRRLRYTLSPFLSLYIIFQPNPLTLSVSRNKETCKSKQATTNRC